MFIALLVAWKMRLNLLSTYLSTLIVNPFNGSIIYYLHYKLGSYILGNNNGVTLPITFNEIKYIAKQLYLGGLIISVITSIIVYFLLYFIISTYRKEKIN